MEFPTYIPEIVKKQVINYLDGDGKTWEGWIECLKQYETNLIKIKEQQNYFIKQGERSLMLAELQIKFNEEENNFLSLKADVDCIKRLVYRFEMEGVFDVLCAELSLDSIDKIFQFAWSVNCDYSTYRNQKASISNQAKEISKAASDLAKLLEQTQGCGVMCPSEFYSLPDLLSKTDNANDLLWKGLRHTILGDDNKLEKSIPVLDDPPKITIRFVSPGDDVVIDPLEQARNEIKYTWGTAPDLSALLRTVSQAADEFTPEMHGFIGAAISTRQTNSKTEYLRGFLTKIKDSGVQLPAIPRIYESIATMACVALNDDNGAVTVKDIRDLLKNN